MRKQRKVFELTDAFPLMCILCLHMVKISIAGYDVQ